jgi:flavin reductase (DIM6/NTAB) family NADH-FMN oxidoreductase RutF
LPHSSKNRKESELQTESKGEQSSAAKVLDKAEVKEQFGRAMGRIANGVYVLTLERKGARDGMLTTWVSQAAFEPPLISVAIKAGRPILSSLQKDDLFVINVLSKGNTHVFKNFAKPDLPGESRFEGLLCESQKEFGPVLSDAVSYMCCIVRQQVPVGDHVLVFGEVVQGTLLHEEKEPMVHLRKSGFQY